MWKKRGHNPLAYKNLRVGVWGGGVRVTHFEGLSQVCTQLYRKLYSDPRVSVEVIENRRKALDGLESKVTLGMHKILSKE